MKPRNRDLNIFSMSALDLFASALGAFIVLAVIALPFFPNTSLVSDAELERQLETAEEDLEKTRAELEATTNKNEELKETLSEVSVQAMDLVIVLDITGSMSGVINNLKTEIKDLVQILERIAPSLGVGVIVYGDRDFADYVTRVQPVMDMRRPSEKSTLIAFVNSVDVDMGLGNGGNPTPPEAIHSAMNEALQMNWRTDSVERHLVFITDAPAYSDKKRDIINSARRFARSTDHHISTVQTTDPDKDYFMETKELLEEMSEAGNGAYVNRNKGESLIASMLLAIIQ